MAASAPARPALAASDAGNAAAATAKPSAASAAALGPSASGATKVDDFAIGKLIGEGRYGKVFKVKHLATGKIYVMKAILKAEVVDDGVVHQLKREVEIHARCRHENIARFCCYFQDEERAYIIMEYCNGGTLLERMQKAPGRRLPEDEARTYMLQLTAALTYLRESKAVPIIHRDVKPENILFCKQKVKGQSAKRLTLKLADFGWAVQYVPTSVRTTLCGTPEYLPPEVCNSEEYSGAFDMWTLGVLLYEMLEGRTPFFVAEADLEEGEDLVEAVMDKIRDTDVVPVPEHFSPEARDLVHRLLDRDQTTRILLQDVVRHPFLAPSSGADAEG